MLNATDVVMGALAGGAAAGLYLVLLYAAVRRQIVSEGRSTACRALTAVRIVFVVAVVAGLLRLGPAAAVGAVAGFVLVRTLVLAIVGRGPADIDTAVCDRPRGAKPEDAPE